MKLAKREKYFVTIGACAIAVFFLFQFLIFPFFEKKERIRKGIITKELALKEIVILNADYNALKRGPQRIRNILAGRQTGFTLFSFLERAGNEAGIKDHIKYLKPSVSQGTGYKESLVEMKLEGITLQQLVKYLYLVESPGEVIFIKRLSVKENKKLDGYLDAVLQAFTFQF
ncbi:MAG: hypothetical protein GY864_09855 [Desulfobacterales bacterium]|nr:hypothetical protein [Desulfobacterales bacterium]